MKVMLLAAGRGERMGELTANCPKPLLKVAGKSLIEHHIERLVAAGFSHVVVNVCYLADQIMAHLGDGSRWGIAIQYSQETECLETGGGIVRALNSRLLDDRPFLVINADVWTDYPLANLASVLSRFAEKGVDAHLVLVPNPDHNAAGDFCLNVSTRLLSERLPTKEFPSHDQAACYTFAGISILHPGLFAPHSREGREGSQAYGDSGRFPLAPLLQQAMGLAQVTGELYQGEWVDVGTPERLDSLN
jgi:MurNAc alpha-1-phosphate uridylyltransferase